MGAVGRRGPREEKAAREHPPRPRRVGEGGDKGYPHLGFSPAGLGLGPACGSQGLSHRPQGIGVAVCFCQPPALPTTCAVPPPGCHMIKSPPLLEKGRQLGASTGCSIGQTTPGLPFAGGGWPRPLRSGPAPLPGCSRPPGSARLANSPGLYWAERRGGARMAPLAGRLGFPTLLSRTQFGPRVARTSQPLRLKEVGREVLVNLVLITRSR